MAAGYLQHLAGDQIEVLSAGSAPGDRINPVAVQAMAEEGINIAGAQPKILTNEAVQHSDVAITMECGDECPYYPGKRYEDWESSRPRRPGHRRGRPIRDEIRARIEKLIDRCFLPPDLRDVQPATVQPDAVTVQVAVVGGGQAGLDAPPPAARPTGRHPVASYTPARCCATPTSPPCSTLAVPHYAASRSLHAMQTHEPRWATTEPPARHGLLTQQSV